MSSKRLTAMMIICAAAVLFAGSEIANRSADLTIGSVTYTIPLDKETIIAIDGKNYPVKLRMSRLGKFEKAGISFMFPSELHLASDTSNASVKMWTIDGDSAGIMIQEYSAKVGINDIINSLILQYEKMKGNISTSDIILKCNPPLQGKRLSIMMGNIKITQDIFIVGSPAGSTAIIIQDSPSGNKNSDEYYKIKELLEKSLNYASATDTIQENSDNAKNLK